MNLIPKRKNIIKAFGYAIYALILSVIITYYKFPYDALKDNITWRLKKITGKDVYINNLYFSFPFKVGIDKVFINEQSVKGDNIPIFYADNIKLILPVKSILTLKKRISFIVTAYGGNITGDSYMDGKDIKINARLNGLKTEKYPFQDLHIMTNPLNMNITGDINITLIKDKRWIASIYSNLNSGTIDNISLYKFKLPAVVYNKITADINIDNNALDIKDFNFNGKEVNLSVNGKIDIKNNTLTGSGINLQVKFKVGDKYLKDIGLPPELLQSEKKEDGFINVNILGTFNNPRINWM